MGKRGNGEGSISRRKGGGWIGQYYADIGGKRKRKTLYAKTRGEAAAKLAKAIADRDGGFVYDDRGITVGEYLERWLADSVKGAVKETTYANYAYVVRKHLSPAIGHVKLKSLTPSRLRGLYGDKGRTGLSAATMKKLHVVLRKALAQASPTGSSRATPPTP